MITSSDMAATSGLFELVGCYDDKNVNTCSHIKEKYIVYEKNERANERTMKGLFKPVCECHF